METIHLDTHAAVWLYAGEAQRFSALSRRLIDRAELFISPMVLLEIQFLREAGKIEIKPERFLRDMRQELGLQVCQASFSDVILSSTELSWTRDPFDRLIVAQATLGDAALITRDKTILDHYSGAVWD